MPDCVIKGKAVPEEKDDAGSVGNTSDKEQQQTACRERCGKGLQGDYHDPAQGDVKHRPDKAQAMGREDLHDRPHSSQPPNRTKQRPSPRSPHGYQGKGGVTSRDHQVNAGVVENTEYIPEVGFAHTVIGGRQAIEGDHCCAVNAGADDTVAIVLPGSEHNQGYHSDETCQRTDTVGETVDNLFRFVVINQPFLNTTCFHAVNSLTYHSGNTRPLDVPRMFRRTDFHEIQADINRVFLSGRGGQCNNLFKYLLCQIFFL